MSGKNPRKQKQAAGPVNKSGAFVFPNGEKYEGEYAEHSSGLIERTGQGTHYFNNGKEYTGQWSNDKMNGKGEMKHSCGALYKGDFAENVYHGAGTYTWPNGPSYCGNFEHNQMVGEGEFTDSSGHVWIGDFKGTLAEGLKLKLS